MRPSPHAIRTAWNVFLLAASDHELLWCLWGSDHEILTFQPSFLHCKTSKGEGVALLPSFFPSWMSGMTQEFTARFGDTPGVFML